MEKVFNSSGLKMAEEKSKTERELLNALQKKGPVGGGAVGNVEKGNSKESNDDENGGTDSEHSRGSGTENSTSAPEDNPEHEDDPEHGADDDETGCSL